MISRNISLKDFGKFEKMLAKRMGGDRAYLEKMGRAAVAKLRDASSKIRDQGGYQAGWGYNVSENSLVVFNSASHARYVEGGRAPGGRMPPIDVIRAWSFRKFGVDVAFAVAKKIARDGIKARPLLAETNLAISGLWTKILSETVAGWMRRSFK